MFPGPHHHREGLCVCTGVTLTTVCCDEASEWDLLDRAEWLDPRDNMEAVEWAEWRETLASSVSGVTCERQEVR